jgi:hypothetical protein
MGIAIGYLLARYGFDLDLSLSRTVATGIVVACGLAVVMRLEGQGGRRIAVGSLCAAMALLFALALVVPFLRHFYELSTPTGEAAIAWSVGTAIGIGGMHGALHLLHLLWPDASHRNHGNPTR